MKLLKRCPNLINWRGCPFSNLLTKLLRTCTFLLRGQIQRNTATQLPRTSHSWCVSQEDKPLKLLYQSWGFFFLNSVGELQGWNMNAVIYLCQSIMPILGVFYTKWWLLFFRVIKTMKTVDVYVIQMYLGVSRLPKPERLESWKTPVEGAPTAFFEKDVSNLRWTSHFAVVMKTLPVEICSLTL